MSVFPPEIIKLFKRSHREFDGDRQADAEKLAREQPILWQRLLEMISEAFPQQRAFDNDVRRTLADIIGCIRQNPTETYTAERSEKGGWVVRGILPVLESDALEVASNEPDILLLGGFVAEMRPKLLTFLDKCGFDPKSLSVLSTPLIAN